MARHPAFFEGTEMPDTGWWEMLWPDPAGTLIRIGLERGMDVIDLCCGDGWFTLAIAKTARHVVAIDLDEAMLNAARRRLAAAGLTNCEFIAADAYEVARLAPNSVDFVLLANAFHGVPDPPRLVRAVGLVLRPGGRFAVVNWHQLRREETTILGEPRGPKTELRISPQQTITCVEAGGLTFTECVELPPYHYATLFAPPRA
jgi:SAM-dependent methyltransferase